MLTSPSLVVPDSATSGMREESKGDPGAICCSPKKTQTQVDFTLAP